jgi:phosphomannomutase/phosphoglucomutase
MSIFRAYDIRGIYPKDLNEEIAKKLGKAFGTFNRGKIVVGMDARLSSPTLKKNFIEGLLSVGCEVMDVGMVITPMLMFAVKHLKTDGGVVITASHNPKDFNGFKFFVKDGIPISHETGINKIQEIFEKGDFSEGKGSLEQASIFEDYSRFLLEKINFKTKPDLSIVVDAGNGVAGLIYPRILKRAGLQVHELFCEPDGNFPNHEPNPSKEENLIALKEKVKELKADLGFAYDGDGDRMVVIKSGSKTVRSSVIFSIFIKNVLREHHGAKIVYTPLDSKAIEDVIKENKGIPILSRVGHTYVTQRMLEEDAWLAGEISSHYYFKETYASDDALFATLRLIEILVNEEKTIEDYEKEFPKYYSAVSESLRFPIKESEKFPFIEKLKEEFKEKGFKIDTTDGVKVFFDYGWALFRPSNTEAVISASYEAYTKEGFEKMKEFVEGVIARIPR